MNPDKSLQNLFNAALERSDAAERARFLDEACGADAALRERVDKLLRAQEEVGAFMAQPSRKPAGLDLHPTARVVIPLTEKPGDLIGRYKLLQQIGEGGCGVVYMVEQEEPVRRRVALKVIKLGMDTKQVIARFEAERQALALMDHPNIARVLDAGATETGRPYFVMELVRGTRITEFCDQKELPTQERLDLFLRVCSAVQHAHQKGIIHRDIKPSNILVTVIDGVPVPKVIDFGIAKATNNQPLTDKTVFTAFEQFIGTPAYMSPEQAELSGVDIDTRTDIYSLGVVLYELLTGSPPFDQKELLAAGLDEMRRTIRETEPPRPSNRLSTMAAAALTATAHHRHTEPPRLVYLVRGDLDWIAMKCLEKDRARRYETANALAADIRRHLDCEPVIARPPSRWYEFQKTVRRHKFGFAAATALILVLMLGVVISTWQAVRATKAEKLANDRLAEVAAERDAKEQARQEAESISAFMSEVIQSPDPTRDGHTIQVVELLDKAAKKLDTELAAQPGQRAKLQARLASTYYALSLSREAIPLQEKVRDYHLASLGQEHTNTLRAMTSLANSYHEADRWDESLKMREEVLALNRKVLGPEHPDTLLAILNLAISYDAVGRRDEALKMREEVLALDRKVLGPEHPDTLNAMISLAVSYHDAGRKDEELKLSEEALTLCRKVLGPEHPDTLLAIHNLAHAYRAFGRNAEALQLLEVALPLSRKLNGPEHQETLHFVNCLAISYGDVGRSGEALKMREEVLPLSRKVNGPEHPHTLDIMTSIANSYSGRGRRDEALKLHEEVLTLHRKIHGPEHPGTLGAMINLAWSYRGAGRLDEAIQLGQSCLEISRRVSGPTHSGTLNAMTELAITYKVASRIEEAIALEEESLRLKRQHLPPADPLTIESMENLAACYEKADRKPEAEALRREAAELKAKAGGK